jgi:uncharacterized protein
LRRGEIVGLRWANVDLKAKTMANISSAVRVRYLRGAPGKYRFHLKAPNGEIIAASQGYESKANAEKGIEAIKTHAPGAKVEDHS